MTAPALRTVRERAATCARCCLPSGCSGGRQPPPCTSSPTSSRTRCCGGPSATSSSRTRRASRSCRTCSTWRRRTTSTPVSARRIRWACPGPSTLTWAWAGTSPTGPVRRRSWSRTTAPSASNSATGNATSPNTSSPPPTATPPSTGCSAASSSGPRIDKLYTDLLQRPGTLFPAVVYAFVGLRGDLDPGEAHSTTHLLSDEDGKGLPGALQNSLVVQARSRYSDGFAPPGRSVLHCTSSDDGWRALYEPARRAARRLVAAGEVEITQGGRPVAPAEARGPIRIRRVR
ncbi:hypothetical protein SMICM304S_01081 [Streptomyces microflavus]